MSSLFTTLFSQPTHCPVPREISEEEKSTIATVFNTCDEEQKGYLTQADVKIAVVSLFGYKPSKYEICELFKTVASEDEDVKGMELNKFVALMSSKMAVQDKNEEIRQMFMAFDTRCRGFLTVEDLIKAFGQVAPHISQHRIETAFREVDRDGDGRVSYKDFEFMMLYNTEDGF